MLPEAGSLNAHRLPRTVSQSDAVLGVRTDIACRSRIGTIGGVGRPPSCVNSTRFPSTPGPRGCWESRPENGLGRISPLAIGQSHLHVDGRVSLGSPSTSGSSWSSTAARWNPARSATFRLRRLRASIPISMRRAFKCSEAHRTMPWTASVTNPWPASAVRIPFNRLYGMTPLRGRRCHISERFVNRSQQARLAG